MSEETPKPETEDQRAAIWQDDVLERRRFADYLTRALTEQTRAVSEREQRGLTVALDAGWGIGKTFFVKRWVEDLKAQGHPVVYFDAWENDLGEEAVVALMAAIKGTVDEWIAQMPVKQEVKAHANEMMREGIKQLRRAVAPVSKVVGAAVLKKVTGIGVKEMLDALDGEDAPPEEKQETISEERVEAGLDKIFESALAEQKKRGEAIISFKRSMVRALKLIEENAGAKTPFFIFVDELDRCRPLYAIKLLEEIKHIFGLQKTCFIVSTNIEQLSHSIRAVYGNGFDAEHYFQRFFEKNLRLSHPSKYGHIKFFLKDHPLLNERKHQTGIMRYTHEAKAGVDERVIAIGSIFKAFNLDMRTQKRAFDIADMAISQLKNGLPIHTVWLFFLCSMIQKDEYLYAQIMKSEFTEELFIQVLNKTLFEDESTYFLAEKNEFKPLRISEQLLLYFRYSRTSDIGIRSKRMKVADAQSKMILDQIIDELPATRVWSEDNVPSLFFYPELVRNSGYLTGGSSL